MVRPIIDRKKSGRIKNTQLGDDSIESELVDRKENRYPCCGMLRC